MALPRSRTTNPRLPPGLKVAAWLFGGAAVTEPPVLAEGEAALALAFLRRHRVAAECAACSSLADSWFSPVLRRGVAVERERVREVASRREAHVAAAGEAFHRAGVRAALLKGLAVVELTHGDASRRPMADGDVLVAPADRGAAREALLGAGFAATTFDSPLHDVFVRGRAGGRVPHDFVIEVHGDVLSPPHPFALDLPGILERSRPSRRRGLLVPERADAVVLTAFQLAVHETDATKTLAALRDVALLAAEVARGEGSPEQAPWETARTVIERARAAGLLPFVAGVGRLAVDWAGAPGWLARPATDQAAFGTWRRRLAARLTLGEAELLLLRGAESPRIHSRRLVSALWQDRVGLTLKAIARAGAARGAAGGAFFALRHVQRALGRVGRSAEP